MKHDPQQGYVGHHQHEQQLNRNLPDTHQSSHDRHSSHEHAGQAQGDLILIRPGEQVPP